MSPLWLPPSFPGRYFADAGLALTAGTTSHTKGAWTEVFASTPFDTFWLGVLMADLATGATLTSALVDIGIGPAGSETVVIPDLLAGAAAWGRFFGKAALLPVYIRAGSRVSARAQAAIGGDTITLWMHLYGDPPGAVEGPNRGVYAYGIDAANSRGVVVPPFPTWAEVTAATSVDHQWWYVMVDQGNNTALEFQPRSVTLAVGPAGSETVIGVWRYAVEGGGEHVIGMFPSVPVYRSVPAGTRVAVRTSSDNTHGAAVYAI